MTSTARIAISGMTCGACSSSITSVVSSHDGIINIAVSLITEEAKVEYDDSKCTVTEICQWIEDCGFDAKLCEKKLALVQDSIYYTSISIEGMTCGACSASIIEALEKIKGVESASVSLITETGMIIHNSTVSQETIVATVEDCGFDCKVISSKHKDTYTVESSFSIHGMTCGSCSSSITAALKANANILDASISLVTEEALVSHKNTISSDEIVQIIQDCGFEANFIKSDNNDDSIEEISLQIYGINDNTDLVNLQYNIESLINKLSGVIDFHVSFQNLQHNSNLSATANSQEIQAMRSHDNDPSENIVDELSITFNPSFLGRRELVDQLNGINPEIEFVILNSIDQASATQLKVLSRVKDIQYWKMNFIKALVFGLPVIILNHTQTLSFFRTWMVFHGLYVSSLLQLLITTYVQFVLGWSFIKKFWVFVSNKSASATMDVLVCISTLVSYIYSVVTIIFCVWNGKSDHPPKLLFDTTCMLVLFISFGKWLENKAKGSTSTALSKLVSLTPTNCTIVVDVDEYEAFLENQKSASKNEAIPDFPTRNITIDLIQTNDIAIVLAGGKIPADGEIVYGESEIDESLITGESLPVYKRKGDEVIGGSINGPELIHIRVLRSGKKSQLQQIINLVKDSQVNKAPVQRFADLVAARFVPGVLILASATFILWTILCSSMGEDSLPMAFKSDENGRYFVCLKLAISVIVVACPCALGLAAPTAVMVGTGVGASHGVLIKGGDIFERASSIHVILFDKTGTLTTGNMRLVNSKQFGDVVDFSEWWNIVGTVESNSEHPIGKSIVSEAREKLRLTFEGDSFLPTMSDFKVVVGMGVKAKVQFPNGKTYSVFIGNERMLQENIKQDDVSELLDDSKNSTNTLAHVLIDGQYSGYMEFTDQLKDNAKDVVYYLRHVEKYQVAIVTGDSHKAAKKIGDELGIQSSNIFSEVSPMHKDKVIVDIKQRFGGAGEVGVVFVGDGINDAPALAQADIGMAISSGTDIAMESADIVLLGNKQGSTDLIGVINALKISNLTFSRIKWNFVWAACYNILMLPFAMGIFLPLNVMLPPVAAGGAMMLSSVSVVLNSLLLKTYKVPVLDRISAAKLENEISTETFSLQNGTLEEFNKVKRSKDFGVRSILSRVSPWTRKLHSGNNGYELMTN